MPWILFFFLGGAAVLAQTPAARRPGKFEFQSVSEAAKKKARLKPAILRELTAGAPYRLVDVLAMGERILDYAFAYNGLAAPPPLPNKGFGPEAAAARNAWTLEQYLGSILERLRREMRDYAGLLPDGLYGYKTDQGRTDDQTRARLILLRVIAPILAGRVEIGSHPSVKATKNITGQTGNVGPIGSDRPWWAPWAPLRRYMDKDTPGGTLAQQDFIRSSVTWLLGYFLQPGTACFYADAAGNPVLPSGGDEGGSLGNGEAYPWRKGSPGWRYTRDPVRHTHCLNAWFLYFRRYLDLFCKYRSDAEPSPCATRDAFNLQILQPASREEEARFLDDAARLQVYAEGNLQRLDVTGNLAVALYAPREVKSFDWSTIVRVVLAAVAVVVQVVPGIGQAVGGVVAAATAVTNAAIGFVKAALEGGQNAAEMAFAFGSGILEVLQKSSLLTQKDIDKAKGLVASAKKAAGVVETAVDQIQQQNFGGAAASGMAGFSAGRQVVEDAADLAKKAKGKK